MFISNRSPETMKLDVALWATWNTTGIPGSKLWIVDTWLSVLLNCGDSWRHGWNLHLKLADISLLGIRKNYPKLASCLPFIVSHTSILLPIHVVNEQRQFFWKEHEVLFRPRDQKSKNHYWFIKQIHAVQFITRLYMLVAFLPAHLHDQSCLQQYTQWVT